MTEDNYIDESQKLMIEMMISDQEVFAKTINVMDPRYFDKPLNSVVKEIQEYFRKHHGIPKPKVIKAKTGIELEIFDIDCPADVSHALDEIETYCQEKAMGIAILDSVDDVNAGNLSMVAERVRKALMVSLDRDVGINITKNAAERVKATNDDTDERSIGIPEIDRLLNNIRRREVGIVYGTTGAGKSVTLGNFAYNLAKQGLNVFLVTLELQETLYAKRLDCIFTGADIALHQESAYAIEEKYDELVDGGCGSVVVKYLKTQSTASDIRNKLLDYELEYKMKPDVILVDYMGLMGVDGANATSMNKFDFDELKIFALQSIASDYNAYLITAGQLNRDGADIIDISHKHVAGGLSAVNGSDWSIAIVATEEELDNNQFQMKQLKIRNGARTTMPIKLYKSPTTLRISSSPNAGQSVLPIKNPPRGTEQDVKASVDKRRPGKAKFGKPENASDFDDKSQKSRLDTLLKRPKNKVRLQ